MSYWDVLLYFEDMFFTQSLRSFVFHIPVFGACLFMACMLGQSSVVLAGEEAGDAARTHALLINGGGNRRINYQSHLLHVNRIYRILNEAGVPGNQISILSSDGSDPAPVSPGRGWDPSHPSSGSKFGSREHRLR